MYNCNEDKKINSFAPLGTAGDFGRTDNGGKGSGNFGHAGREGKIGGSAPSGSASGKSSSLSKREAQKLYDDMEAKLLKKAGGKWEVTEQDVYGNLSLEGHKGVKEALESMSDLSTDKKIDKLGDRLVSLKDLTKEASKLKEEDLDEDTAMLYDIYSSSKDREFAKKLGVNDKSALDAAEADYWNIVDSATFGGGDVSDKFNYESLSTLSPKDALKIRKTYLETLADELSAKRASELAYIFSR